MLLDQLILALRNIKEKGARSWLTIIGVFIGIATVVALISITQGLAESVETEFEAAGTDTITVYAGMMGIGDFIDEDHVDVIEGVRGVKDVGYLIMDIMDVRFKDETETTFIWGASEGLLKDIPQFDIEEGREIREMESGVAVIGNTVYPEVFEEPVRLRDNLEIKDRNYRVVGRLGRIGMPTDDESIMIPLRDAQDALDARGEISVIYVVAESAVGVSEVADNIEEALEEEMDEDEFTVQTMESILQAVDSVLSMIQAIFVGVAGISLFVGGVGIMSTMYTSVLEKTRDIGIMKAVGARNENIMTIFLFESGLLGLTGGVLGVILGLSIAKGGEYLIHEMYGLGMLRVSVSPELIIGALVFSFIVGTLSGVLPARKAAGLNPVDALRAE